MGVFADSGPLQIFVSCHLIPEDFGYSLTTPTPLGKPAFVSGDGYSLYPPPLPPGQASLRLRDNEVRIQAGTEVRLRIMGTRTEQDCEKPLCPGPQRPARHKCRYLHTGAAVEVWLFRQVSNLGEAVQMSASTRWEQALVPSDLLTPAVAFPAIGGQRGSKWKG